MPVTQRKRSMMFFRKMKFTKSTTTENDEAELDIDKMMMHCMDCLGALQCVSGNFDSSRAKVFWNAVITIAEIGMDSLSGHMDKRHPGGCHLLRAFPNDAKATDSRSWLPLHWAAVSDNVDVQDVRRIARSDPMAIARGFNQPISANPGHLISAVRNPNMQVVKCLFDFHPRMANCKDNDGDLPLHYAARYSESVDMIQFLLQCNPCVTKMQGDGSLVPLQCAIYNETDEARYNIIKCLLATDPTAATIINADGDTALHLAIDQDCRSEVIKLLLDAYPQAATIRNDVGLLPLHVACYLKQQGVPKEVIELLLQAYPEGCRVEAESGHLPAHYAAEYSTSEVLELVLQAYPDAVHTGNALDNGNTPLMKAVIGANESTVMYLCEHYPESVKSKNYLGRTALFFASEGDNVNILRTVYKYFPEAIRQTDNQGKLPLHAFTEEHQDYMPDTAVEVQCLKFLLEHYPESPSVADNDGYTPYSLCNQDSTIARRLLLNACPSIDRDNFKRLNYKDRRMGMFLAYAAINADGIPNIFCQIRSKDSHLLKQVFSYL